MAIIICFILWCVLATVAAVRFERVLVFSTFERQRLSTAGEHVALKEAQFVERRPLYDSLQFIVRTLIAVAFVTTCVTLLGIVTGTLVGAIGLLAIPFMYRLPFVCKLSDRLRDAAMPFIDKVTDALHPLLSWLRERDAVSQRAPQLNSQTELLELIKRSPGVLSSLEQQRLEASLAFDAKTVSEIMTPKSMIRGVEAQETLGPLVLDELYKTGYSRFPVYEHDIDHVVGMLYLHDLIDMKTSSKTAAKAMQPKVFYIHEHRDLSHALYGFLKTRHHLFVVVNDYRETVGLLSLEDAMEALIGATIVDEFDAFDNLRAVAEHNPNRNNQPEGKKDI